MQPVTDPARRLLKIMAGRITFVKRSVFDKMGEIEQELSNLGTTQITGTIPAPTTARKTGKKYRSHPTTDVNPHMGRKARPILAQPVI